MTLLRAKRKRRKRVKIGRRVYPGKAHTPIASVARSKGRCDKSCGRQKAAKNYDAKDLGDRTNRRRSLRRHILDTEIAAPRRTIVALCIPKKSQPLKGRFAFLLGRRPQWNRRQPHDRTPMTRQDDLNPSLRASNKIGQMGFG
jgi:hypothetical protein